MRTNLAFVEEVREQARTQVKQYKLRVQEAINTRLRKRSFQIRDRVWKQADSLKDKGKLEANKERPYQIHSVLPGRSYYLMDDKGKLLPRPWNVCHLKKCYA